MLKNLPQEKRWNIIVGVVVGLVLISFYLIFTHFDQVVHVLGTVMSIFAPFLYGLLLALCMLPLSRVLEAKLTSKLPLKPRSQRKIAVVSTLLIFLLVILLLLVLLIPELIRSASSITTYVQTATDMINQAMKDYPLLADTIAWLVNFTDDLVNFLIDYSTEYLPSLVNNSIAVVSTIINIFLGFFLTFFYLLDRERFGSQISKITYAILPKAAADEVVNVTGIAARMFDSYITGKLLDALLVGIATFIGCTILNLDYAAMIAVIVGVTNIIPYFGPIFGSIPCGVLLFLVDPMQCLKFVIMILVIQQIDGNVIEPIILGRVADLQPFWILFAILVFGGMFGFLGMFLGVPLFATIFAVVREIVHQRLERKGLRTSK